MLTYQCILCASNKPECRCSFPLCSFPPFPVALLFIILMILRRRGDTDGELTVARAPLLCKERPQGRYYGIPCDGEPVYAGWWPKGPEFSDRTGTSPVAQQTEVFSPMWVSAKDKEQTEEDWRYNPWTVLRQPTGFLYVVHFNILPRNRSFVNSCSLTLLQLFPLRDEHFPFVRRLLDYQRYAETVKMTCVPPLGGNVSLLWKHFFHEVNWFVLHSCWWTSGCFHYLVWFLSDNDM